MNDSYLSDRVFDSSLDNRLSITVQQALEFDIRPVRLMQPSASTVGIPVSMSQPETKDNGIIGNRVEVIFSDDVWYPGIITSSKNTLYRVRFDDGAKMELDLELMDYGTDYRFEQQHQEAKPKPVPRMSMNTPFPKIGGLVAHKILRTYYYAYIDHIALACYERREPQCIHIQYVDVRAQKKMFHGGWIDRDDFTRIDVINDNLRNFIPVN